MALPVVLPNYFQERAGVIQVAAKLNQLGLIFRETPNADVGIDGQIEYVNEKGEASGKLLAVQIKSGNSYFIDKESHWAFYVSEKHREYWQGYPIPVFLLLHQPETNLIYFTDARHYLSVPNNISKPDILVPKTNLLDYNTKWQLFQAYGYEENYLTDLDQVLQVLITKRNGNNNFPMSFFDLFAYGLTNLCRHLYYSISVAIYIAEENLEFKNKSEFGIGLGSQDHEFLNDFVKFIMSQNLVKVDYADFLIDWTERMLQPSFLSPLTVRGQKLVLLIKTYETKILGHDDAVSSIVSERSLDMVQMPGDYYRNKRIYQFQGDFLKLKE